MLIVLNALLCCAVFVMVVLPLVWAILTQHRDLSAIESSRRLWCNGQSSSAVGVASQAAVRAVTSCWSCGCSSEFCSNRPAARTRLIDSAER